MPEIFVELLNPDKKGNLKYFYYTEFNLPKSYESGATVNLHLILKTAHIIKYDATELNPIQIDQSN